MGILDSQSKAILVESMRNSICGALMESTDMSAADASARMKYVRENATYEQLLNITMNPDRETNYLPDHVLEGAVAILHSACLTGRKYIGQNAIAEGAMKLQKATGCVITESMLDAALNAVEHGNGLKVIGSVLKESAVIQEAKAKETSKLKKALNFAGDAVKKAGKVVSDITGVAAKKEASKLKKQSDVAKKLVGNKMMSGERRQKMAGIAKRLKNDANALSKAGNKKLAATAAAAAVLTAGAIGTKKALSSKKKSVKESVVVESPEKAVAYGVAALGAGVTALNIRALAITKKYYKKVDSCATIEDLAKLCDDYLHNVKLLWKIRMRSGTTEYDVREKKDAFWKAMFSRAHKMAKFIQESGNLEDAKKNIKKMFVWIMISYGTGAAMGTLGAGLATYGATAL